MYKLSKLAATDFAAIYEYSLLNFGVEQADAYTEDLEKVFELLYQSPFMGNACEGIGEDVRMHYHHRHSIYYLPRNSDIFILRILHGSMKPSLHKFEM